MYSYQYEKSFNKFKKATFTSLLNLQLADSYTDIANRGRRKLPAFLILLEKYLLIFNTTGWKCETYMYITHALQSSHAHYSHHTRTIVTTQAQQSPHTPYSHHTRPIVITHALQSPYRPNSHHTRPIFTTHALQSQHRPNSHHTGPIVTN